MELIISFKKSEFDYQGTHLLSGKIIFELQRDWEESFHAKYHPFFANVLEGHQLAMQRITKYMEFEPNSNYNFGMDLIDGEVDIDANLAMEEFSMDKTVYAIGSQFQDDEDNPLFLVKNDNLKDDILILKYVPDQNELDNDQIPVNIDFETKII